MDMGILGNAIRDLGISGFPILSGVVVLFFILLVVGVILALSIRKSEKTRSLRVSAEMKKIDDLFTNGKISEVEAEELKGAISGYTIQATISPGPDVHVKIVGILQMILGILPFIFLLPLTFLRSFIGIGEVQSPLMIPGQMIPGQTITVSQLPSVFLLCAFGGIILYSTFRIYSSIMLLKGRQWARIAIIILSVASLTNPIGLAIGLYSLWVLVLREESADYFRLKSDNK